MAQPLPSALRRYKAAATASAASMPASRSAAGVPTFCGGASGSPVHDPAVTLGDQIVAGQIAALAAHAEAGDRHVHQIGLERRQGRVVYPQLRLASLDLIGHDHVGVRHQRVQQLAPAISAEIEGDAALVAVYREKPQRLAGKERRPPAAGVVAFAPFHLDHAGAEIGEQQGRVRAGDGRGQVQHPHAFEQTDRVPAGSVLFRQLTHRQHDFGSVRLMCDYPGPSIRSRPRGLVSPRVKPGRLPAASAQASMAIYILPRPSLVTSFSRGSMESATAFLLSSEFR